MSSADTSKRLADRPASEPPQAPHQRHILYVATEDWFFRSHFLPMARTAMTAGFRVTLAARLGDVAPSIAAEGIGLIDLALTRGSLNPIDALREAARVQRLLRREAAQHPPSHRAQGNSGRQSCRPLCRRAGDRQFHHRRRPLRHRRERQDGAGATGRVGPPSRRCLGGRTVGSWSTTETMPHPRPPQPQPHYQIGGAGVDPDHFAELPLSDGKNVTAAVVARMLWSKGIDTTVEAQRRLRQRGIAVDLTIAGPIDRENPTPSRRRRSIRGARSREYAGSVHRRTSHGLARRRHCRSRVARRRGTAARAVGGGGLRPAHRHDRRAWMPRIRP